MRKMYDYRCDSCGEIFERLVDDAKRDICPPCRTPGCFGATRRVMVSAPAVYAHGCPSYEMKRNRSEEAQRRKADARFAEENDAKITEAYKKNWKWKDGEQVAEADRRASAKLHLVPTAGAQLKEVC